MMTTITLLHKKSFQSTHSLRSATEHPRDLPVPGSVSIHALLAECDHPAKTYPQSRHGFNPRTPCGVRLRSHLRRAQQIKFQSTHSLRSATLAKDCLNLEELLFQSTHSLRSATLAQDILSHNKVGFNPRTPCGVRQKAVVFLLAFARFQSTHSLRSATAPDLIHCYSTEQIILCANLPKKTVIARLLFLSIYLSIFYSQCITPIADLPGNSCELEVGAQAMFNSL